MKNPVPDYPKPFPPPPPPPKKSECCTCGYSWRTGMDGSHSCAENLLKYKKAFHAAKNFIDSHVADPDITDGMCARYAEYQEALDKLKV